MNVSLTAPAMQICAFALGCALIHAARAHATAVTRLLIGAVVIAATGVLLAAATVLAPEIRARLDDVTVHAAQPLQATSVIVETVGGP